MKGAPRPIPRTPNDAEGDRGEFDQGGDSRHAHPRFRRQRRAADSVRPEPEITGSGALPPLIPEGTYQAVGNRWSRFTAHRCDKLVVYFKVSVPDTAASNGVRFETLPSYYNITALGRRRFSVGAHSGYMRDWIATTNRRPSRKDRLAPSVFENVLVEVDVRTVTKDGHQRRLPEAVKYSVISRVVGVVAGGGTVR